MPRYGRVGNGEEQLVKQTQRVTPQIVQKVTPQPVQEVTPQPVQKVIPQPVQEVTPQQQSVVANPITQVNLSAVPGQLVLQNDGQPYVGLYHIHQDGTKMTGAGILGDSHTINPQQILISASGYSYQEPTEPEFLQYLDTVGFDYLQNKVPNIREYLNKFNSLFNIFGAYLSGGYLRRVIKTGDAFDHQNSDIDFFFSNETKFRAAVNYVNSGDLNTFNKPTTIPYNSSRLSYKWNLNSKDSDFPNVTINLMSTIFDIRYRLAAWDLTNSKIATNNLGVANPDAFRV